MGIRDGNENPYEPGRDQVRGIFGEPYQNRAGRDLHTLLGANSLCLPTTFHRKRQYTTWINPCSKRGHQLDHMIMRQSDLKRVKDAGRYSALGAVDSDHVPILLVLTMNGKTKKKRYDSTPMMRIDRSLLKNPLVERQFIEATKTYFDKNEGENNILVRMEEAMRGPR